VLGSVLGVFAFALLVLVGPPPGVLTGTFGRRRRRADGVAADGAAPGGLGQTLKLVGGLVDCLQVALMLVAASGRGDVRVPAFGHSTPRKLHRALVKRRLDLQQQERCFDVQDPRHERASR